MNKYKIVYVSGKDTCELYVQACTHLEALKLGAQQLNTTSSKLQENLVDILVIK